MTVEVLIELKAKQIDQTFSYSVNSKMEKDIMVGKRVLVPFNNQSLEGFILKINNDQTFSYELKEIIEIIDEYPVLNDEMLELGKYISKKTLSTLISAYQTMLPNALKAHHGFTVNKKYTTYLKLIKKDELKGKQKEIIDLFLDSDIILKKDAVNISLSSVNTLIKNGYLIEVKEETYRMDNKIDKSKKTVDLTPEQKDIVTEVTSNLNSFKPYLLHGVTGSGKTEVYMHIIENVKNLNKEVLVLVPEISLTPQLVDVFKNRFGNDIAILHSALSNGEKYDEWRKILKKEVSIVIGARSAVFAPLTNLGLIIIDEEHSSTYKQENTPAYSTIDIALYRAKKHSIPLVLGSATPSIESYTRAMMGVYKLLELKTRINKTLPSTYLIDMKEEIKKGFPVLSGKLIDKINDRLNKHEQIIILLNRRGYTTVVSCHNCGFTLECPNCDIPLTHHKNSNIMRCHYCSYATNRVATCPECKSKDINEFGMGTEKLEQILNKTFKARVLRMDTDTTTKKGSHEQMINSFKNHEYDILIGTQMISKGLDFPLVTLVGVLNGDASLNIPDFRSSERTFQLLNQVAGRSGRGSLKGEVIIQGFNIDHYSIKKASVNDYIGFYNEEMTVRKTLKYPPFYSLLVIRISSKDLEILTNESNKIGDYLKEKKQENVIILGPSMQTMPKINNIYHMQIIVKYKKIEQIFEKIEYINNKYKSNRQVKVLIDINPYRI